MKKIIGTYVIMMLVVSLACNAGISTADVATSTAPPAEPTAIPPSATPDVPTPTDAPEPTATFPPTPTPRPITVLLVAEDLQSGHLDWTSFDEIGAVLESLDVIFDTWRTYTDRYPIGEDLAHYDVVIWTAGDDCCDSPPIRSVEAMVDYLNGGGSLLMEGGSVVYPWTGTIWPTDYLGVEWLGASPVGDMMVADASHPIAAGFSGGSIDLIVNGLVEPDSVEVTTADPVFQRGPRSSQRGRPLITAHDTGFFRVVYSAVPIQWLSSADRTRFLENALNWLRQKTGRSA